MPAPAASYSLRLVKYQVSRTMCSGPAPASANSLMIRSQGFADLGGHVGLILTLSSPPV